MNYLDLDIRYLNTLLNVAIRKSPDVFFYWKLAESVFSVSEEQHIDVRIKRLNWIVLNDKLDQL